VTEDRSIPSLTLIGAPTSAGAYAPGQEDGPAALRKHGLADELRRLGAYVNDAGDIRFPTVQIENVYVLPGIPQLFEAKLGGTDRYERHHIYLRVNGAFSG